MNETRVSRNAKHAKKSMLDGGNKKPIILGSALVVLFIIIISIVSLSIKSSSGVSTKNEMKDAVETLYKDGELQQGVTSAKITEVQSKLDKYDGDGKEGMANTMVKVKFFSNLQDSVNNLFKQKAVDGTVFNKVSIKDSTNSDAISTVKGKVKSAQDTKTRKVQLEALAYAQQQVDGTVDSSTLDSNTSSSSATKDDDVDDDSLKNEDSSSVEGDSAIETTLGKLKDGSLSYSADSSELADLKAKIEALDDEDLKQKYLDELESATGISLDDISYSSESSTTTADGTNVDFGGKTYVDSIDEGLALGKNTYNDWINAGYSNFHVYASEPGADKPYYVVFYK